MSETALPSGDSNPYRSRLRALEEEGRPVRVAVVGAGDYGETLVEQLARTVGLRPSLVCDLDIERARASLARACPDVETRTCDDEESLRLALRAGVPAAIEHPELVPAAAVDVVVECTGDPEQGCRLALESIEAGQHVVMVNAEADATAGWLLAERARNSGVVYSLADGDQPSLLCGLVDWAELIGFEVVSAGKWTKRYSPKESAARLEKLPSPSPSDVTNLDGSKTQIELAAAGNSTGLGVDREGMHGPAIELAQIPEQLRPAGDGGILALSRVVDYVNVLGLPAGQAYPGGVFVVVSSESRRVMQALAAKGVPVSNDLRHALLFRPQHLVGAETIRTIVYAAVAGRPTASPRSVPTIEVAAVTKKSLPAGSRLQGLGGSDIAGVAVAMAAGRGLLPAGLADGCRLKRNVAAGAKLGLEDVEPPADSVAWRLRSSEAGMAA